MSAPARTRPAPMAATVVATERLSPTLVRVVFGGPQLSGFRASQFTDSYVKLTFLKPGVGYPEPFDLAQARASLPQADWPVVRTYTVRSWDQQAGQLAIDFVVHGDAGTAGPWAANAVVGDTILISGPGGAYRPDPELAWHLFAGDESALPAIAAAVESLPANARGAAVIEVPYPDSTVTLPAPAGVRVQFVVSTSAYGEAVTNTVRALEFPSTDTDFDAFVHGEAGFVKALRTFLRAEKSVPRERLSVSGYWRLGATEDGWREGKAEWNKQAEDEEKAAGAR